MVTLFKARLSLCFFLGAISSAMASSEDDIALRQAASLGDIQAARMLISKGTNINAQTPQYGGTALMLAAMKGKREVLELLLANGADVNAVSSDGNTALIFAALSGYREIVQLLLARGADINAKNKQGISAALIIPANERNALAESIKLIPQNNLPAQVAISPAVSPALSATIFRAQQDFSTGETAFKQGKYAEALSWYRQSAEQGYASAQYSLGAMYENGQGVTQDLPQAVYWYRKAAEQGNASAQFSMGVMADTGQGMTQDYQQAIAWYSKAAERGEVRAQNNLGFMYSEGKGATQNDVTAHMWFNISGVRGYEEGRKNRDFVEKRMTREQISAAQQQASEWMKIHP